MLKSYKVRTYISVNNKPKIEVFQIDYGLTEDELPRVVATSWSFKDCFDEKVPTPVIKTGVTSFRKRPYVEVEYSWSAVDRYYNFDSITVERHYEPYDITLDELFKKYSADKSIQYLKERGMNTCPYFE